MITIDIDRFEVLRIIILVNYQGLRIVKRNEGEESDHYKDVVSEIRKLLKEYFTKKDTGLYTISIECIDTVSVNTLSWLVEYVSTNNEEFLLGYELLLENKYNIKF